MLGQQPRLNERVRSSRCQAASRAIRSSPADVSSPAWTVSRRGTPRALALVIYNQMVVETKSKTDDVFHALADSTRRDILRRAGMDASSVSRLADAYPMSFAAVQKHVVVLERAGLVTKRRRGREQLVEASPETLAEARRALDDLEEVWRGRVERMSELLESD
jgi:DNA-binding transcriptional ArsR family regulator